jgi:two-component sensor histidine kinase
MQLAAQFAAFAAATENLQTLQRETCRIAAEGLRVTYAALLVYRPEESAFVMEAGVGWRPGFVGVARFVADFDSAAGFAWHGGQPVIANDLVYERRFRAPPSFAQHDIASCADVIVPGAVAAAYGVLKVASSEPERFTLHDVFFLQLLAYSLASAISRSALRVLHEAEAAGSARDHEVAMPELQHRVRNDLQIIYSVVAGEAGHTTDLAAKTGFERVGGRVLALAEVYNHLLSQRSAVEVDMGAYLRSLCGKIASANDLSARGITLNAETQRLMMPPDRAVRLGIAVNDLVGNAAKYAFPDGTSGRITVGLAAAGANGSSPVISVADDGCGFTGLRREVPA